MDHLQLCECIFVCGVSDGGVAYLFEIMLVFLEFPIAVLDVTPLVRRLSPYTQRLDMLPKRALLSILSNASKKATTLTTRSLVYSRHTVRARTESSKSTLRSYSAMVTWDIHS
jgi:hypothetical protein